MSAGARRRAAAVAILAVLSAAGLALLAVYFTQGRGRLDFADHARGRDFVNLWTAGRLIGEGRALQVFDPPSFMAAHHRLFDPRLPLHFWSYPPPALLLAAPFALAPGYFAALAAWTGFGLVAMLPAARTALARPGGGTDRTEAWLLMLCPAAAANLGLGQNGAVTAALLLGGLALLDRRPRAAGALMGLLAFKPQIALLLPVMVVAGGRWRTMWAAAATAAALLALSTAVFGLESWRAFLAGSLPLQGQMLRFGHGPFMSMMPSAYMAARLLGASWTEAALTQAPFTLLGGVLVWRAWRTPGADAAERAAVLGVATFIASPQAFNYDLIPTAFAALVLLRRSLRLGDVALAAAAWALPLAMIPLGFVRAPLAPLVLTVLACRLAQVAGMIPRRAARASAAGEAASQT